MRAAISCSISASDQSGSWLRTLAETITRALCHIRKAIANRSAGVLLRMIATIAGAITSTTGGLVFMAWARRVYPQSGFLIEANPAFRMTRSQNAILAIQRSARKARDGAASPGSPASEHPHEAGRRDQKAVAADGAGNPRLA